jgi:hypothetical protein
VDEMSTPLVYEIRFGSFRPQIESATAVVLGIEVMIGDTFSTALISALSIRYSLVIS